MSKPVCVFQSPMWTRSGYGDLGLAIAKSLHRYGKYELVFVPTRWGGCSRKFTSDDIDDPLEKELFNHVIKQPLSKQPELFIQCTIPNEFQAPGKFNMGITAGIETTIARQDWIEGLNRMNFNLVTSNHAKKVFDTSIYTDQNTQKVLRSEKPMEVLFWGADTSIYTKDAPKNPAIEAELSAIKEDFCFLFVGQWTNQNVFGDRKDIGNLIRVFCETFANMGDKKKPALLLKTSGAAICNMDKYDIITRIKAVKDHIRHTKGITDLPNVYLLHGELTESEMNALYNHDKIKAHASFTHGEGFGHPLLLSTLSGKPLLVSNWSGHLDFLDPKLCKLLDGEVAPLPPESVNEWLIQGSAWFSVNYQKAAELFKSVFHHYAGYIDKAEQLRVKNVEQFSIAAMDKVFHAQLDKYVPKFATETKLVLPRLKKVEKPIINVKSETIVDVNKNKEKTNFDSVAK
jgi:hypothetical protein